MSRFVRTELEAFEDKMKIYKASLIQYSYVLAHGELTPIWMKLLFLVNGCERELEASLFRDAKTGEQIRIYQGWLDRQPVFVKQFRKDCPAQLARFHSERSALSAIHTRGADPRFPQAYTALEKDDYLLLIIQKMEGLPLGEWADHFLETEEELELITDSALETLVCLHDQQSPAIIHGDIKPEHLLYKKDANGKILVAFIDFDASTFYPGTESICRSGGYTPGYAAPEHEDGRSEPRSDVFALARTVRRLAEIKRIKLSSSFSRCLELMEAPEVHLRVSARMALLFLKARSKETKRFPFLDGAAGGKPARALVLKPAGWKRVAKALEALFMGPTLLFQKTQKLLRS